MLKKHSAENILNSKATAAIGHPLFTNVNKNDSPNSSKEGSE